MRINIRILFTTASMFFWAFAISCFAACGAAVAHGEDLYPDVTAHGDAFYTKQIGENLYCAMERVGGANAELWQRYAKSQETIAKRLQTMQISQIFEGLGHFSEVLHTVDYTKNEIWVAYVSTDHPKPIVQEGMANYKFDETRLKALNIHLN